MKTKLIITTGLLLVFLLSGGCAPTSEFDNHLSSIVEPYRFSITSWEFKTLLNEIKQSIFNKDEKAGEELGTVREYFSLAEQIKTLKSGMEAIKTGDGQGNLASIEAELSVLEEQKTALEDTVERIVGRQISETLTQEGILNPFDEYIRLEANFPPLNFELEKPPHLLVISPRDRIESIREIILLPDISLEETEHIEAQVDNLGVSSLVAALGGIATYPSLVVDNASLRFTIYTVTEEWLHQYLAFKPLGFLYLLDLIGMSRNYEIATMTNRQDLRDSIKQSYK